MILIISTCQHKLSELEFVKPVQKLVPNHLTVRLSEVNKVMIEEADKIIICGTALKDFKYLDEDVFWIKDFKKPLFGICSGVQLISKAFGFSLKDFILIGSRRVKVKKQNDLWNADFKAYFLHTKTGSGNFEVLAEADELPCMIKHPDRPIYGCIFHPEVMNEVIIKNFVKKA